MLFPNVHVATTHIYYLHVIIHVKEQEYVQIKCKVKTIEVLFAWHKRECNEF